MAQIYKLSADSIREQASLAREHERRRKEQRGGGDFLWGDINEGDNVFRPLPPTNSRGILGKRVAKHYVNNSAVANVAEAHRCLALTHPEVDGVMCPTCDVGDKLIAQYPQLEIGRWHRPGINEFIQAVDRSDPDTKLAKIYRLTPAIYNWLVMQIDSLLTTESPPIDLTDIHQGMDVKITKTIEEKFIKGKKRSFTKYDKTLWNPRGLSPIAGDEASINAIVSSMRELDDIWKYPNDEELSKINQYAANIYSHYVKQMAAQSPTIQVPGVVQTPQVVNPVPQVVHQQPQVVQPVQQVAQPAPVIDAHPQYVQPQAAVQNVVPTAQPLPTAQPPQQQPSQVAQQVANMAQNPVVIPAQQNLPIAPSGNTEITATPQDMPACFGGAQARKDGGVGYEPDCSECLMCPVELKCLEACKTTGAS